VAVKFCFATAFHNQRRLVGYHEPYLGRRSNIFPPSLVLQSRFGSTRRRICTHRDDAACGTGFDLPVLPSYYYLPSHQAGFDSVMAAQPPC
jgi:hypothetical protein